MKRTENDDATALAITKTTSVGVSEASIAPLTPAELAVLAAGLPPRIESSAEDIAARLAARRNRIGAEGTQSGEWFPDCNNPQSEGVFVPTPPPQDQDHVADLEEQVAFTMADASRLLRKRDVQGACPHPNDCFYETDRVRCGPCAVKASAAKGVEIDDTHSHLPEVCRLRREVRAAAARIAELESATPPAMNLRAIVEAFLHAHDTGTGLIDRIDNRGGRYSSQFLATTIAKGRAAIAASEGSADE